MRLMRISLATKYRILFGTAVLLIIWAALAVPWYYMEVLVLQQPFREAESIADAYFRVAMPKPDAAGEWSSGVHGGKFGLLPERSPWQPTFLPLVLNPEQPGTVLNTGATDPFINSAFQSLRRHPSQKFFYRTVREQGGRRFRYAHAVWVTRRCLDCHAEGRSAQPLRENQLAGIITIDLPAEMAGQSSAINRVVIVAAGALAGVLAILVFYFITTRFILAPIHELRSVALKVSEGDLTVRSTVATGDEFQQLSDNLNTMLERLRASQDELRKANRLLDEKLGEMAETNVALYEANRVKSEFLANVSHELRTPLTSIIGFAELLREGPQDTQDTENTRGKRYTENILISGRILLEIINDLLDLAKIEAGKVELRIKSVSITDLCDALIDHLRPLADRAEIVLDLHVEADLPAIFTDPGKLRQIMFNLASNAIKFTPAAGRVTLQARRKDATHVQLLVSDTGPGIALEHQEVIFEKFRQIDQSATREHHGTGLGLAIARELTYLLGGTISLESKPGHGATFFVTLPISAPPPRTRPLIPLS